MNLQCQEILYSNESHALQIGCKVMPYVSESIGQLIQRRLKELGLSKADVAKLVGVSRAYIGDLANGTAKTQSGFYRPKPEIVSKLAATLKIGENDILDALGYTTESGESFEILDGVSISFTKKKMSKAEKDEILDVVKTVVAGLKARKEGEQ